MYLIYYLLIIFNIISVIIVAVNCQLLKIVQEKPPEPKHGYKLVKGTDVNEIANQIDSWTIDDDKNVWELSGLYEGDIVMYHDHDELAKNGIIDSTGYWPDATIPYHIDENFSTEDTVTILKAMIEYHNRTCIKFRPYRKRDKNWIQIKSDSSGCWSSVGMQGEGQVVNLQNPGCVHHGVVAHELLHALGFFHQQSASDRDKFVKIHWENIQSGREHNFNKYNQSIVTDYGFGYDYTSVMHYSAKAFSKNNEITIESLQNDVELGQRNGLSDIDIKKLNKMYESKCKKRDLEKSDDDDEFSSFFNWFAKQLDY